MGRFKKFIAVLVPAVVATSASSVGTDLNKAEQPFDQARDAGTYEAMTRFLLQHPDAEQAKLAQDAIAHSTMEQQNGNADGSFQIALTECIGSETMHCEVLP